MDFKVVIPARYASTRLPGKPLLDISGKPMVVRVIEQALKSGASDVVVATDHHLIRDEVTAFGYKAVMTRVEHVSGTDRIAEVVEQMHWQEDTVVVNVQGDEPLISPALIQQVAHALARDVDAVMATACHLIHEYEQFTNPNVVKVVLDKQGRALYFSRAPIPFPRDDMANGVSAIQAYRHIGLYAYRAAFLHEYATLPHSPIEQLESLEQLRVLWSGYKIAVHISQEPAAPGVDTQHDLEHIRKLFS
jgi:3-deoxy-manno-octulosonate cytidylyltransferase (CMP-KDO synthetase)